MSGGGKKGTPATAPATQPVASVPTTTFGAFMPDTAQGLLANQLAMGGYGAPDQISGLLAAYNKPVTLPMISTPDQIAGYLKQIGKDPVAANQDGGASGGAASGSKSVLGYDRSTPVGKSR